MYLYNNRTIGHRFNAWFGTEYDRNNIWFEQIDQFITYIKRCNYMLRQGDHVADIAYFIGEDAPKMDGVRDPELPVVTNSII